MPKSIVVNFSGELDTTNIEAQGASILKLIEEQGKDLLLILDFKELKYMNSTAIGNLAQWYLKLKEIGGLLVIAQPNDDIRDILEVVGLAGRIKIFPTIEEAENSLAESFAGDVATSSESPQPVPEKDDAAVGV